MRTLKVVTVASMLVAVLALAPVANAQNLPTVSVTAGAAITEGETADFTLSLDAVATDDLEVNVTLEETERAGDFVNSNLVPDSAEGARTVTIPEGHLSVVVSVATTADGVHEDFEAREGQTKPTHHHHRGGIGIHGR